MLKVRVIPTLLWKDVGLVKGIGFDSWRRVGPILPAIKVYNTRQVDELIIVDILATNEKRRPDFDSVRDFSADCFVPLTVGGGITSLSDVRELLRAGADKVCINTAAYNNINLVTEISNAFGAQCVVASIDAKKNYSGDYECYSNSGKVPRGISAAEWAERVEKAGAGEILLTSIERDGSHRGFDLELIKSVTSRVKIPVIAAGGADTPKDFIKPVLEAGASAVSAASIFHYTQYTPLDVKIEMSKHGIPVRLVDR
ncbi:imidazole glycerol phosphate synthase subunit HisF [Candidatus Pacearchaeota archaeon]|nr:imidazole glycerol phosphate synthase subunit HisF [Candidatus Pacearchaeota archaeon]